MPQRLGREELLGNARLSELQKEAVWVAQRYPPTSQTFKGIMNLSWCTEQIGFS